MDGERSVAIAAVVVVVATQAMAAMVPMAATKTLVALVVMAAMAIKDPSAGGNPIAFTEKQYKALARKCVVGDL